MKIVLVIAAFWLLTTVVVAQEVPEQNVPDREMESMLRERQSVAKLMDLVQLFQNKAQIEQAVRLTENLLKGDPANHDLLMKGAYLHYRLGWLYAADREERKSHFLKFFNLAERAKQLNPGDYYSLLLLAAAKSKKVAYLSNGDQVRLAREMAEDIRMLLAKDSDNPETLYLASWLNFEIGRVPAFKKMMAMVLFSGLPKEMTVQKGFGILKELIKRNPGYVVYQYDLGIFHLRTGDREEARIQFGKVVAMDPQTTEGRIYKNWGRWRLRQIDEMK